MEWKEAHATFFKPETGDEKKRLETNIKSLLSKDPSNFRSEEFRNLVRDFRALLGYHAASHLWPYSNIITSNSLVYIEDKNGRSTPERKTIFFQKNKYSDESIVIENEHVLTFLRVGNDAEYHGGLKFLGCPNNDPFIILTKDKKGKDVGFEKASNQVVREICADIFNIYVAGQKR